MTTENTQDQHADAAAERLAAGARRNSTPTRLIEYKVYLDGTNVARVGEWEAEHAGTTFFCQLGDADGPKFARCIDGDDLVWIATVDASNRDAAADLILRGDPAKLTDRAKVVRAAWESHIDLEPRVIAVSAIGEVPAPWTITYTPRIGGRKSDD